jgi:hypothetical protein
MSFKAKVRKAISNSVIKFIKKELKGKLVFGLD